MQLDRQGDRWVRLDHGRQDVGKGYDSGPDRASLPAKAARCECQDGILHVCGDDGRRQELGCLDRVVQPHDQIARIQRDRGDIAPESIQHGGQFVHGQVGVGFDCDLDSEVGKLWRQEAYYLDGGVDLSRPGNVAPEPIVAISHVGAGVTAAERRHSLDVPLELPGPLGRLDIATQLSRAAKRVWRGQSHFQIEPHRVHLLAKSGQAGEIELRVDRSRLEKLHAVEGMRLSELHQCAGL